MYPVNEDITPHNTSFPGYIILYEPSISKNTLTQHQQEEGRGKG